MRPSWYILPLLATALCVRCGDRSSKPAPPPAATPKTEAPKPEAPEVTPATNAPEFTLEPNWPAAWKEVRRGQAGPEALPLVWFELDAGNSSPDTAARAALDALRPLAGALAFDDLARAQDSQHVIAQFRGERLSGVIDARPSGAVTMVRVTLEPSH